MFPAQPANNPPGTGLTWDIVEKTIQTIIARISETPTIYYGVSDVMPKEDLGRRPIFFAVSARLDGVMDLIVMHPDNLSIFEAETKRLGVAVKPASERPVERLDPNALDMVRLAQLDAQNILRRGMRRSDDFRDEEERRSAGKPALPPQE